MKIRGRWVALLSLVLGQAAAGPSGYAGLWSGIVSVDAVSELAAIDADRPTPTTGAFEFRVLLHVDTEGTARLLKSVVVVWQTEAGAAEVLRHRLYVDSESLQGLDPATIGPRLSSAAYDFPEPFVELDGVVGEEGPLRATIRVPASLPSNPFAHRKHPDHNNLDEQGRALPAARAEVYSVRREMQLRLESPDTDTLSGDFRETLHGLTAVQRPITVSGQVLLRRVSSNPEFIGGPWPLEDAD